MDPRGRGRADGRGRAARLVLGLFVTVALVATAACSSDDGSDAASTTSAGDATAGTAATTTSTPTAGGDRYTMANGLDVILYPVEDATDVVMLVAFDVGEVHDPPGQSGLAHVSEQLYSTAATGFLPPRAAFEQQGQYPAGWWSETSDDHTISARRFPPDALEAEIAESASRMTALGVSQEDLDRERDRVLLDLDTILAADPPLAARTRAEELIQPSPNGGNQGGIPAQVAQLDLATVTERLAALYKPANATLVLVGAFDPDEARAYLDTYFTPVPAGAPVGEGAAWGLAGFGETASVVVAPRTGSEPGVSTAAVGYLAPAPTDPTYPAFLAHVVRMRAAGPADAITVGYAPLITPGVVTFSSPVAEGETDEAAVERIRAWVAAQLAVPIDDETRAAALAEAGSLYGVNGFGDELVITDPYAVALSLARTSQLGVDGDALGAAIEALDDEALATSTTATFTPERSAAAVVVVEPKPPGT
jgi:zinc protease